MIIDIMDYIKRNASQFIVRNEHTTLKYEKDKTKAKNLKHFSLF